MSTAMIIDALENLPIADRLYVIEQTVHSIRKSGKDGLEAAVAMMQEDYRTDSELTAFTQLDTEDFYETR